ARTRFKQYCFGFCHLKNQERLRRDASSSATSISIRKSAVEKVFPCASVISESVPPPPRLSCRRKLSAPRFGNSKRSTSPLQIPRKCSFTRDAVTSRASSG